MGKPFKRIHSGNNTVWITQPYEEEELLKRRELAFNIARGKLSDNNGKLETMIQTGEAFGRGLFDNYIKNEADIWNMKRWVKPVVENVLNPLGTGATFTKITEKQASSLIFKCPLHDNTDDQTLASIFTYGYLKGLLLSAFPDGEIDLKQSISEGAPLIEFMFKAETSKDDKSKNESKLEKIEE